MNYNPNICIHLLGTNFNAFACRSFSFARMARSLLCLALQKRRESSRRASTDPRACLPLSTTPHHPASPRQRRALTTTCAAIPAPSTTLLANLTSHRSRPRLLGSAIPRGRLLSRHLQPEALTSPGTRSLPGSPSPDREPPSSLNPDSALPKSTVDGKARLPSPSPAIAPPPSSVDVREQVLSPPTPPHRSTAEARAQRSTEVTASDPPLSACPRWRSQLAAVTGTAAAQHGRATALKTTEFEPSAPRPAASVPRKVGIGRSECTILVLHPNR